MRDNRDSQSSGSVTTPAGDRPSAPEHPDPIEYPIAVYSDGSPVIPHGATVILDGQRYRAELIIRTVLREDRLWSEDWTDNYAVRLHPLA
jgi:hypothetical protein